MRLQLHKRKFILDVFLEKKFELKKKFLNAIFQPCGTGKSTFIKKVIETIVVPNIKDEYERKRALDEIPQSANGKTIMTIEPKFVPNNAAKINIDDFSCNIRLIDCVGYLIKNAKGSEDENGPRMVKCPWVSLNM